MLNVLFRTAFFLMGSMLAASLVFAVGLLMIVWMVRAGWARLTGRPVRPWVMRFDPRSGFERFRAAAQPGGASRAAEAASRRARVGGHRADIDDAVVKPTTRAH